MKNRKLLNALGTMVQLDESTRDRLLRQGRLYGHYAEEMQQVHIDNARALEKLISHYGWPGISKVGLEGCRLAWLVAQHANCTPDLQRGFAQLLEQTVQDGDAPSRQLAYLSDRIRFNEGRLQRYGLILDWNEAGELGC